MPKGYSSGHTAPYTHQPFLEFFALGTYDASKAVHSAAGTNNSRSGSQYRMVHAEPSSERDDDGCDHKQPWPKPSLSFVGVRELTNVSTKIHAARTFTTSRRALTH